ncbi:branched-chain amino acid ABC transporter permease [Neobacillus niacini]|uniref:branched-chain amino acid ABC transporter permease n=1 Tax=Neobacillus niacini TaxID=86668 RepID=UPI0027D7D6C3|nr:branched-chain amino acid ABC transporter permease [Neobacillus niacini]
MVTFSKSKLYLLILLLLVLLIPFMVGGSGYFTTLFVMTCIYIICSLSLNLLVGYGGQISVGNAGFLAVGSYTVAILSNIFVLPIWLTLPLAGIFTGIVSIVIGIPAVRLSGPFLAVATLGFGISVPQIALNWESLTNGYTGLTVTRPLLTSSDSSFFYVVVGITLLIIWMLRNILKGQLGRAFIAIRDSEVAAQANGINVAFYKTMMFAISAFFTGIAGGLYSYWIGYVSPDDFTIVSSLLILGMVVVGGAASIPGSIIGAVLLTIIPHFTDSFIGVTNIVIGIAFVLIILFRPKGLISIYDSFIKRIKDNKKKTERGIKQDVEFSRNNGSI